MLSREGLIEDKKKELQEQLTRWAQGNLHLAAGEQLIFTLSLGTHPIVIEAQDQKNSLLSVKLENYITRERLRAAGANERMACRTYNVLMNIKNSGRSNLQTVADLISLSRHTILNTKNSGKSTLETIEKVLRYDSLQLSI